MLGVRLGLREGVHILVSELNEARHIGSLKKSCLVECGRFHFLWGYQHPTKHCAPVYSVLPVSHDESGTVVKCRRDLITSYGHASSTRRVDKILENGQRLFFALLSSSFSYLFLIASRRSEVGMYRRVLGTACWQPDSHDGQTYSNPMHVPITCALCVAVTVPMFVLVRLDSPFPSWNNHVPHVSSRLGGGGPHLPRHGFLPESPLCFQRRPGFFGFLRFLVFHKKGRSGWEI